MSGLLGPTIASVEGLFQRFSWRRLIAVISILALTIMAFVIFEIYSGHVELARLERAANVLKTLRDVDSTAFKTDKNLIALRSSIGQQLRVALNNRSDAIETANRITATVQMNGVAPFFAGAIVWWLLALAGIPRLLHRAHGAGAAFRALVMIGVAGGFAALLIPTTIIPVRHWYWLIYPSISLLLVLGIIVFAGSSSPGRNQDAT